MLTVEIMKVAPEKHLVVKFHPNDVQLIRDIKHKISIVQACKVMRLMANCTLLDAKRYVDSL